MTVHMHEEDVWIIPEEMIVERRDIDSIVEKRGENRIHFVLQQHQVAHHHIRTIRRFGQGNPAAETEGRGRGDALDRQDRKSTRLNSSHGSISYAVFCLKKKKK